MTNLNNELSIDELDNVSGGGAIADGYQIAANVLGSAIKDGVKAGAIMLTLALGGSVTVTPK